VVKTPDEIGLTRAVNKRGMNLTFAVFFSFICEGELLMCFFSPPSNIDNLGENEASFGPELFLN
jgi:hypothetical protein